MPRRRDPSKVECIMHHLNRVRVASLYELGKVCNSYASTVSPIVQQLVETGEIAESKVIENGRLKRIFSTNVSYLEEHHQNLTQKNTILNKIKSDSYPIPQNLAQSPQFSTKYSTQSSTQSLEQSSEQIPEYYHTLDRLFSALMQSSHNVILSEYLEKIGSNIDEIVALQNQIPAHLQNKSAENSSNSEESI